MWLITICLVANPNLCFDQLRYGMWMNKEDCVRRIYYSDVRSRMLVAKQKVEAKCIVIPEISLPSGSGK